MQFGMMPVEDHEEWLRLTERAEDGVYTMHGFVAMNAAAPPSSPRWLVTDGKVVEKAVERLREEFGWGPLAVASGPMLTVKGRERHVVEGGWWIVVPVDYHEHFHDPELCEFRVRARGRDVALHAREFAERRSGEVSLPEFGYTSEYAVVDRELRIYNDHPSGAPTLAAMLGGL